jgi:hypothetical protein
MRWQIRPRLVLRWDGVMRGFIVGRLEVFWWPRTHMRRTIRTPHHTFYNFGALEIAWRRARG